MLARTSSGDAPQLEVQQQPLNWRRWSLVSACRGENTLVPVATSTPCTPAPTEGKPNHPQLSLPSAHGFSSRLEGLGSGSLGHVPSSPLQRPKRESERFWLCSAPREEQPTAPGDCEGFHHPSRGQARGSRAVCQQLLGLPQRVQGKRGCPTTGVWRPLHPTVPQSTHPIVLQHWREFGLKGVNSSLL